LKRIAVGIATTPVAVCCCVMVACGGFSPVAGWSSTLYSCREYAFAIEYPSSYVRLEVPTAESGDAAPLFHIFFADPEGATIAGKAVDTLDVSVYEMNRAPTETDLKMHQRDFVRMVGVLDGKLHGLRIVEPFTWGTFADEQALKGFYTYRIDGKDVAASATLVIHGTRAYLIRAQASRETWGTTGRLLMSSVASFSLL